MRLAALTLLALTLSAATAAGASRSAGVGFLSIEDGRGVVQITGRGGLSGRLAKGSLEIVDLTPADQWSPFVNGIPRGRIVWLKGQDIGFRVPKGRYRITARGSGISISASGVGRVILDGMPDATGYAGTYAVGDAIPTPLPAETTKVSFGAAEIVTPSSQSVKIQP